jgi:hypothetical protein
MSYWSNMWNSMISSIPNNTTDILYNIAGTLLATVIVLALILLARKFA